MARALLSRGVTSFLPTAPTLPRAELPRFADRVRAWIPAAPRDGAEPIGFNLEGPFLAPTRRGSHDPRHLLAPDDVSPDEIDPLVPGLRIVTVAPELPGALGLIEHLASTGVVVSLGHSGATFAEAQAGFAAGARSVTHLFNAMTGLGHRDPGLAVAALLEDAAAVELIADGYHVDPALWPLIVRAKPPDRLILVSDAISLAGIGDGTAVMGGLRVEVRGGRVTLAGSDTLAGSVIALDTAVANLVRHGTSLVQAVRAAASNPAQLLGAVDRGVIEVGRLAHLVELDDDLRVRRVMRSEGWLELGSRGL